MLPDTIKFAKGNKLLQEGGMDMKKRATTKRRGATVLAAMLAALLLMMLALSGCGGTPAAGDKEPATGQASEQKAPDAELFPLTLDNYAIPKEGGAWQPYKVTFEAEPQRVVANTQAAAELLIKLGLGDKVVGVGALYGEAGVDVKAEFDKIPVLSETYLTKEQVLGADPDLVFGRGDLFTDAELGVGSVDELNGMGVKTYLQHSSRDGATLSDIYKDIEELGELFSVEDAAAAFKSDLQTRVDSLVSTYGTTGAAGSTAQTAQTDTKTDCFVVPAPDGSYMIFAGPRMAIQEEVLGMVGLTPVSETAAPVSNEQLIEYDPDVIILLAYTGVDADALIAGISGEAVLQTVGAVETGAIYVGDMSKMTYSFRVIDELERLAPLIKAK
jgi:iron complex transport system substrate-binding protein